MALAKFQRQPFGEDRSHVAEARGGVKEGKNRASFQEKIPCKLQDVMKNTFDFRGENSTISVKWINKSRYGENGIFSKRSKRWRGFPADEMIDMFWKYWI